MTVTQSLKKIQQREQENPTAQTIAVELVGTQGATRDLGGSANAKKVWLLVV